MKRELTKILRLVCMQPVCQCMDLPVHCLFDGDSEDVDKFCYLHVGRWLMSLIVCLTVCLSVCLCMSQ